MHQFIYQLNLLRPEILTNGPTTSEAEILSEHAAYIEQLALENIVLLAGRTQTDGPDTFGIVIFLAESEAQAADLVNADPAVKEGVMEANLYPYRIAALAEKIVTLAGD